jgi:hypothetical protein
VREVLGEDGKPFNFTLQLSNDDMRVRLGQKLNELAERRRPVEFRAPAAGYWCTPPSKTPAGKPNALRF